jgi:hypothetical protein
MQRSTNTQNALKKLNKSADLGFISGLYQNFWPKVRANSRKDRLYTG